MYSVSKSIVEEKAGWAGADTTPACPDPNPTDPWLFTDPVALEFYCQQDRLDVLEEDICTYGMFEGRWMLEELEYKHEIRRMLQEGFISAGSRFGYLSPHPTVYHTLKAGNMTISGHRYVFQSGEDLVFEPWLARYSHPGLIGPLHIGWLTTVSSPSLCCDAFPLVCIHCDNTRAIMRQILSYRNNEK